MGKLWAAGRGFLLAILGFFHNLTGSYGIAIIMLTILIRLLLYPLSHKQMVSMSQMQKIQPRLKVLQEKYGDDKQKLNEEMMRLYKEHNVNPLAGCFPLLVQLPILILLFQAFMNYEVAAGSTFLGIHLDKTLMQAMAQALSIVPKEGAAIGFFDVISGIAANPAGLANVSLYLPSLLFILFICFLTWLQQKMSGAANNPQMATMNVVMPFFMGFICLSLPGGVLVYWGTSSLIGILQQWFVMRRTKAEIAAKPVLYKNKPGGGQAEEQVITPVAAKNAGNPVRENRDVRNDDYDDDYEEYEVDR